MSVLETIKATLPSNLKTLVSWAEEGLKDDKTLQFDMDLEVFGRLIPTHLLAKDVCHIGQMRELTGTCIAIYQR